MCQQGRECGEQHDFPLNHSPGNKACSLPTRKGIRPTGYNTVLQLLLHMLACVVFADPPSSATTLCPCCCSRYCFAATMSPISPT